MSTSIVMATAATAELEPAPVPPAWILNGTPEARNRELAKSRDGLSFIVVWECTPGRFNWHYSEDETVVIISGEVFITNENGDERRLGAGDMAFFPAGTSCTWRVTDRIRKVAVLRRTLPSPMVFALRVWNKLLRIVGREDASPLMMPARLDRPVGTSR